MNEEKQKEVIDIMNKAKIEKKVPPDWQKGVTTLLYKKGESKESANFRGITLGNKMGKIYARILESILKVQLESIFEESWSMFRKER